MAQLPDTAISQPPISNNNNNTPVQNVAPTTAPLSQTTEKKENNDKPKENPKKYKMIKIKILMIRQAAPFMVVISTSSTVLQLKQTIDKYTSSADNDLAHMPFDRQRLIYKGHALKNKDTILKCGIKDAHAIHLVPQKSKPSSNPQQPGGGSGAVNEDTKSNDDDNKQQSNALSTIDHMPYQNVICPKCARNMVLTQPMLCYAHIWMDRTDDNGNTHKYSIKQIVNGCNNPNNNSNNNANDNSGSDSNANGNSNSVIPEFDESKHGAGCDMRHEGCTTSVIKSNDYCYHCPNRRAHPFGYDLCQNCARFVDNPFVNMNIAVNHVLKYQLNMFADIFYDRYRILINRAIGGQLNDDEEEEKELVQQQAPAQQQPRQQRVQSQQVRQRQGQQRGRVQQQRGAPQRGRAATQRQPQQQFVRLNGIDYVSIVDKEGSVLLIPKAKIEELERADKPLTINDLQRIICSPSSEFRQRVSAVIANPRLIREIFQKECPSLLRDNLLLRKFLNEAFEHIECRIYIQARMALNLQDMIQTVNDIVGEQAVIRNQKIKNNEKLILAQTFKILKASSIEWVADAKRRSCVSCGTGFGMFTKKHHCRSCGDIFCSKHCLEVIVQPNRQLMANRNVSNTRVRLCDECRTKYSYYTYTKIPK